MILRASYWTWKILNNESIPDEMPTAYLMLDGECLYNCSYCTHSRDSKADNSYLSRVIWKVIELNQLRSISQRFKRVCIQTVNYKGYLQDILELVGYLKLSSLRQSDEFLISVSTRVKNHEEIDLLMKSGINDLGIPIDVASKALHHKLRSWPFDYTLSLIEYGAKTYLGRITTHIIVGLGESDRELYTLFLKMKELNVKVALFAFTPVKGTKLENHIPPSLERYRKIQLLRYLMFEIGYIPELTFDDSDNILEITYKGTPDISKAYMTSGCTHCTRPYYNDNPRKKELYNYHK
jgi:biotin synthase